MKLLVIGDSHCTGYGLKNWNPNDKYAYMPETWCHQVAKEIGADITVDCNFAASNQEILHRYLNWDTAQYDVCIILWGTCRRLYWKDFTKDQFKSASLALDHPIVPLAQYFGYVYNEDLALMQLHSFVALTEKLFKGKILLHDFLRDKIDPKLIDNSLTVDPNNFNSFTSVWESLGKPEGEQGHHYSEESHRVWAHEYVVPRIRSLLNELDNSQK